MLSPHHFVPGGFTDGSVAGGIIAEVSFCFHNGCRRGSLRGVADEPMAEQPRGDGFGGRFIKGSGQTDEFRHSRIVFRQRTGSKEQERGLEDLKSELEIEGVTSDNGQELAKLNETTTAEGVMIPEYILDEFPKDAQMKHGFQCQFRPLESSDEAAFYELFQAIPDQERMFIKHKVSDPRVIHEWCEKIDLGRNFPLLVLGDDKILGVATLHQQLGGWKTHIGRVSVLVRPEYRGRGLARSLVSEIVHLARHLGLDKVEAEFIGEQEAAIKMFAFMGFSNLVHLRNYVKDLQGTRHDYILMVQDLITDEEYAGSQ
jgi:GNAT superfamily N-acetyltransferase